jgi:hypothetical protein
MNQFGKMCCVALLITLTAGCTKWQALTAAGLGAAGAGVAAVYYAKGDLEADLDNHIDHVYQTSVSTIEKRGYKVTEKNVDDESGRIDATIPAMGTEKSQDLTIKLERKSEQFTHIAIRIGIFGDEALSRAILDDIQSKL